MNWWFYSKNESLSVVEQVFEGGAGIPGPVSHHQFRRKVLGGPGPVGGARREGAQVEGGGGQGHPFLSEATP